MEELLQKLESILNEELTLHRTLLKTEHDFNQAIKETDLTAIQQYTLLHDSQIIQIEKIEEQRIAVSNQIYEKLGIKTKNIKMSQFLEKISRNWKEKLKAVQDLLKNTISELTKINASNRILLCEGLKVISSTVKMLQQPVNKFSQYGNKGTSSPFTTPRNLVNRIA